MATAKKGALSAKKGAKKAGDGDVGALFWQQIEDAWAGAGARANAARAALASRDPDDDEPDTSHVDAALPGVIDRLRDLYAETPKETLAALDCFLAQRLHDIDRAEVQEVTDGSDDGFLYARGFIVALGKSFYDAVNANPAMAVLDAECEDICYLPAHVYEARFGDWPEGAVSRESCSNAEGWPER